MNSTGFWSWQGIATFPGATAACLLITRVLHQIVPHRLVDVPEVAVSYTVALALLLLATLALAKKPDAFDYLLCLINAVAVSVTVAGGNILFGITSADPRREPVRAPPVERVANPDQKEPLP